jgi:hypothetical protein
MKETARSTVATAAAGTASRLVIATNELVDLGIDSSLWVDVDV